MSSNRRGRSVKSVNEKKFEYAADDKRTCATSPASETQAVVINHLFSRRALILVFFSAAVIRLSLAINCWWLLQPGEVFDELKAIRLVHAALCTFAPLAFALIMLSVGQGDTDAAVVTSALAAFSPGLVILGTHPAPGVASSTLSVMLLGIFSCILQSTSTSLAGTFQREISGFLGFLLGAVIYCNPQSTFLTVAMLTLLASASKHNRHLTKSNIGFWIYLAAGITIGIFVGGMYDMHMYGTSFLSLGNLSQLFEINNITNVSMLHKFLEFVYSIFFNNFTSSLLTILPLLVWVVTLFVPINDNLDKDIIKLLKVFICIKIYLITTSLISKQPFELVTYHDALSVGACASGYAVVLLIRIVIRYLSDAADADKLRAVKMILKALLYSELVLFASHIKTSYPSSSCSVSNLSIEMKTLLHHSWSNDELLLNKRLCLKHADTDQSMWSTLLGGIQEDVVEEVHEDKVNDNDKSVLYLTDGSDINHAMWWISKQNNVHGIFIDYPLRLTGGYSLINHNVPIIGRAGFTYVVWDPLKKTKEVTNIILVQKRCSLLKEIIHDERINVAVVHIDGGLGHLEKGFKKMFESGNVQVWWRIQGSRNQRVLNKALELLNADCVGNKSDDVALLQKEKTLAKLVNVELFDD